MHHGYRHITVPTAAMHTPLPQWVIHVGPGRRSASRNVRYASDRNRIDASR